MITALGLALLLAASPGAQPRTGERTPGLAPPISMRIHVTASEDLDAASLRGLARPGVVLWLQTRSNALRLSTVQAVSRFGEAYVELRSPVSQRQIEQLRAIPAVGAWMRGEALRGADLTRLAMRRVAWSASGSLDVIEARWRALRPVRVRWASPGPVDVGTWARLVQLPGAVFVSAPDGSPGCEERVESLPAARSVRFSAKSPSEARALARCGLGVVLAIEPETSAEKLLDVFREIPTLELDVAVGADPERARALRTLLVALEQS